MTERAPRLPVGWPTLTKGHGTGNDFLLVTDPDADLAFTAGEVAALADRRRGVGADGVIRAVRTAALRERDAQVAALAADWPPPVPEWFMDYRNADGSLAQMCGNGLRVFVAYLLASGLASLAPGESLAIGTRAGVLPVRLACPPGSAGSAGPAAGEAELREAELGEAELTVALGRYGIAGGTAALERGSDAVVAVAGLPGARPGLSVTMPNPHVVLAVSSGEELADADLTLAPVVSPVPPHGTNVEIVHVLGTRSQGAEAVGEMRMRVHERGVGETLSCGTGAAAAVVAARAWAGPGAANRWIVHVPGGTLRVAIGSDGEVELTGPAQLVATLTLRP